MRASPTATWCGRWRLSSTSAGSTPRRCTRAGVEKETPIDDVTDDQLPCAPRGPRNIIGELRSGDVDPRVYEEELSDDEAEDRDPASSTSRLSPSRSTRGCRASASTPSTPPSTSTSTGSIATGSGRASPPPTLARLGPTSRRKSVNKSGSSNSSRGRSRGSKSRPKRSASARAELLYAEYDLVDEVLSTVQEAREAEVPGRDRRNPRRRRGAGNPGGGDGGRCRRRRGHGDGRTPRR